MEENYFIAGAAVSVAAGLAAISSLYRYYWKVHLFVILLQKNNVKQPVYLFDKAAYDKKYPPSIPLKTAKEIISEIRKELEEIYV